MSSFLDLRLLSKAFRRRLLLLGYCSTSLAGSLSAYKRIEDDLRGSEGYLCLALEGFGVVGLLGFGVVGLLIFGVVGRLDRDPVRRRGNRYGDTDCLSKSFLGMLEEEVNEKAPDL